MPSIQVTAVSPTNNTLTATGHGLLTGDRFVLRNSGGALPSASPALASVTTYFARRVDADTIQIAETSAASVAGSPLVDITGVGTGTHFVEHSLPYCENRVAANLTQVHSEDDNEAWDSLKAIYRLLTGQTQSIWSEVDFNVPLAAFTASGLITANAGVTAAANQHVTVSGTGKFKHGSSTLPIPASAFNPAAGVTITLNAGSITFGITTNPAARAPIMLPVGARVLAIRVFVQDNATGPSTLTASFSSISSTGSVSTIASSSASAGSGANQTLTIGSLTTTIAASTSYAINVAVTSSSGSTCSVYMAEVDYDVP